MAYTFVLNDENINSNGFRVLTEGIQLEDFLKNPVMLYEHNTSQPIGIWDNIRIEKNILYADAVFDTDDELAMKIQKKVEKGYLKGASVGLIAEEWQEKDGIMVLTKSTLKEASIVSVPANANALRLYDVSGKMLTGDDLKQIKLQLNTNSKSMKGGIVLNESTLTALGLNTNTDVTGIENAIQKLVHENHQLKQEKIELLINQAIKEGKILQSEKEQYFQLAQKDFELFQKMIENKPSLPKAHQWIQPNNNKLAGRENWTYRDWKKRDWEGLKKLKQEQPELYKELLIKTGIHKHLTN